MHHKSIVLKTALPSSPFEFSLITQLSADKHVDISTPGGLDHSGAAIQLSESSALKWTFSVFFPPFDSIDLHTVRGFHQAKSFYAILPAPPGRHYSVQNGSGAVQYTAARLCRAEHNDFYMINTLSNNNKLPSSIYDTIIGPK